MKHSQFRPYLPFFFLLVLGFTLLLFGGCGPKATNASLAKVSAGMEPQQALKTLGAPDVQESLPLGQQQAERWVYGEEPDQVELVFLGGKLISKSGEFPEKKQP